ncbi:MAG: radical SAM protein [Polyangia bacterium]
MAEHSLDLVCDPSTYSLPAQPLVVLVQPPGACKAFTRSMSVYPPLGLCQLAATVPPDEVAVLDADGLGLDAARAHALIRGLRPKLVGLTVSSYTLELIETFAAPLKESGIAIAVGGPHASLAPLDVLARCPSVDYVVRGEGEVIFPELCARLQRDEPLVGLPGLCARSEGRDTHLDPTILQVQDFAALPFPRLHGLPLPQYFCPDAKQRPMVTMMTTRGCPHRCGFCSSPAVMGKKVRGPAVPAVLDELVRLAAEHGVREVSFVDDVFTINPRRTLALCRGLIERGLRLSWFCNARADQITAEMAEAMAAAGCHQVYLGFESGSQDILDRIHKGATVEELVRGAELLKAAGIARSVGFVLGLPGESDETVSASIRLAQRVRPERLQFTRFTPLVGSPLQDFRPPVRSLGRAGFHQRGSDPVGAWIARAYAECSGSGWGRESW